jgi:hypothetical protein
MNVNDVLAEVAAKLDMIEGLRVFAYPVANLPVPGAIVSLPDDGTFDETYGRGSDSFTLSIWVMVAKADDRAAVLELAPYLNGSGAQSVKATVDNTNTITYSSCDTVTVRSFETGTYTYNSVSLLGAEFTVAITGSGS